MFVFAVIGETLADFMTEDAHAQWVAGLQVFQQEQDITRDFLRCVKYWHSQRQIPGTKEGGYPALAWLFLALHVASHNQPDHAAETSSQRILKLLREFFTHFDRGCPNKLCFADSWCAAPPIWQMETFWAFPSIQDPVDEGAHLLTHEIPAATQLLYAAEFRRAQMLLASHGSISSLFEPREQPTSLPVAKASNTVFAIMKARKLWVVEMLAIQLRAGWTAPFLHRCDCVSKIRARILGVDGVGELSRFPEMRGLIEFTPSDFVSAMAVHCSSGVRCLSTSDLQLWQDMRQLLQAESAASTTIMNSRRKELHDLNKGRPGRSWTMVMTRRSK